MAARINLLPPEIIEKRQSEKRLAVLLLVVSLYILMLVGIYLLMQVKIFQESQVLMQRRAHNTKLNQKIAEFEVFKRRKEEAQKREEIINKALSGEKSWYRLLLKLSIIIPGEVNITSFSGDEIAGLTFSGQALGYNSLVKWLVRLSEIKELSEIWLGSASKSVVGTTEIVNYSITTKFSQ